MINYSSDIRNTVESMQYRYGKKTYGIYIVILLALLGCCAALPFMQVDVTTQSRGMIRSLYDDIPLISIVQGEIAYVNMANNRMVHKGDTLLVIDAKAICVQIETQQAVLDEQRNQYADLECLCGGVKSVNDLCTVLYQAEYAHYKERLSELLIQKKQIDKELQRAKKGLKTGVVSEYDYDKIDYESQSNEASIETLKEQQMNTWQTAKSHMEETIKTGQGTLNRLYEEKKNYVIVSPMDGTVVNYTGIQRTSYIAAGQKFGDISSDDTLIVECAVDPSDIGFIFEGQLVDLQFDAFDYNQWGLGHATVKMVDRNLTIQEKTAYIRVQSALSTTDLSLKNGYHVKLRKGMTLTARFVLTQRSLWNLLFDKMDDWFNPKRMDK